jgi:hypothetical protein
MPLHIYVLSWDVLGMFPRAHTSIGNSHNDNDELEDNGALHIHLDLFIMAYL